MIVKNNAYETISSYCTNPPSLVKEERRRYKSTFKALAFAS